LGTAVLSHCRAFAEQPDPLGVVHDLRHNHATMLLRPGAHPEAVKEHLGQANVVITLDTYSHVAPHMQSDAAEKIDAGMRAALAPSQPLPPKDQRLPSGGC